MNGMLRTVTVLVAAAGLSATAVAAGGAASASSAPWRIETAAGGPGGPGPATGIHIGSPCAVSFAGGQLYVGAGLIRSVSIRTGRLTTPVGTVDLIAPGPSGSPAAGTELSWTCGLTVDHAGNLLIADGADFEDGTAAGGTNQIEVVPPRSGTFYGQQMTASHIYVIAGNGTDGFSGDGGRPPRRNCPGRPGSRWTRRATWCSLTRATTGCGSSPPARARSTARR